jgi:hypothetical protein
MTPYQLDITVIRQLIGCPATDTAYWPTSHAGRNYLSQCKPQECRVSTHLVALAQVSQNGKQHMHAWGRAQEHAWRHSR